MKLSELFDVKPQTMGISGLMLKDGRSLVEALNSYDAINIPPGKRVTILTLRNRLGDSSISESVREEIKNLEIDEDAVVEGNIPRLTDITNEGQADRTQKFVVVMATISLFIITVASCATWGWLAYIEHLKPSLGHLIVLAVCWTMVIWKSQGIISQERRDLISAIVGDAEDKKSLWDHVGTIVDVMRRK